MISFCLLAVFCLNLCGCSDMKGNSGYLTALNANDCPYKDFIVVDVFDFSLSEEDMAVIDRIPYCGGMMFDPDSARS